MKTEQALPKRNGEKWRLGVESPFGELQRVIECTNKSVATSGDYRNYFEIDGIRYLTPLIRQLAGLLIKPPASISVLSDSCMTADGLATGLMVMGTEKGYLFAEQHGLSVLFLDVVDESTIVEHATGEFLAGGEHKIPFAAILAVFLLVLTAMAIVLFRRRWSVTSDVSAAQCQ